MWFRGSRQVGCVPLMGSGPAAQGMGCQGPDSEWDIRGSQAESRARAWVPGSSTIRGVRVDTQVPAGHRLMVRSQSSQGRSS